MRVPPATYDSELGARRGGHYVRGGLLANVCCVYEEFNLSRITCSEDSPSHVF